MSHYQSIYHIPVRAFTVACHSNLIITNYSSSFGFCVKGEGLQCLCSYPSVLYYLSAPVPLPSRCGAGGSETAVLVLVKTRAAVNSKTVFSWQTGFYTPPVLSRVIYRHIRRRCRPQTSLIAPVPLPSGRLLCASKSCRHASPGLMTHIYYPFC